MSAPPWRVQRSKRKATCPTPSSRKRIRLLGENDAVPESKQATLTQIQLLGSPSTGFEDVELLPNNYPPSTRSKMKPGKIKTRRKRSTLTQMDWLNRGSGSTDSTDDELLPNLAPDDAHLIPSQQSNAVNGGMRSTKKRRIYDHRTFIPDSTDEDDLFDDGEYLEANNARKSPRPHTNKLDGQGRKRGAALRTTSIETGPKTNISSTARKRNSQRHGLHSTPLDMQSDSDQVAIANQNVNGSPNRRFRTMPPPQTPPRKNFKEVPSSQTPRSRFSNTSRIMYRDAISPSRSTQRTPLQARSTNLPPAGLLTNPTGSLHLKSHSTRLREGNRSAKKRSCAPRELAQQIEDSEDDGFDLLDMLPTHSTPRHDASPSHCLKPTTKESSGVLEIPESSQQQDESEDHSMLLHTELLFERVNDRTPTPATVRLDIQNPVILRTLHSSPSISNSNEDDDNLGSPVANDTQFNRELVKRTSSPVIGNIETPDWKSGRMRCDSTRLASIEANSELLSNQHKIDPATNAGENHMLRFQQHSNPALKHFDKTTVDEEQIIPHSDKLLPEMEADLKEVAVGDLIQSLPSSSPSLPLQPNRDECIRPASIPRPSQMSTQYPTQFLPMSSISNLPSDADVEGEQIDVRDIDHVTIKDSSSPRERLSQIDSHHELRHGHMVQSVADSEEETDDLDLDAKPASYSIRSPRKPFRSWKRLVRSATQSKEELDLRGTTQDDGPQLPQTRNVRGKLHRQDQYNVSEGMNDQTCTTDPTASSESANVKHTLSSSPTGASEDMDYARTPIPGFNNETQSNFTQGGHVTAAYVHKQREAGMIPKWFTPKPYQLQAFRRNDNDD